MSCECSTSTYTDIVVKKFTRLFKSRRISITECKIIWKNFMKDQEYKAKCHLQIDSIKIFS